MTVLAAAGVGALAGLGIWLAICSLRGVRVIPHARDLVPGTIPAERAAVWVTGALVGGLVVGLVTGWPVAGLMTTVGVVLGPAVLGGSRRRRDDIAVAEAVATWTDMIRDTMAGASGLEEALVQTTRVGPAAISAPLRAFATRLRHQSLDDALASLAHDLDHPSADLLVAALASAGRLEARDLGGLLGRLSEAIRGDVRMRVRIDIGRARIRTSAEIAVGTTAATLMFLYLFAGHLLAPYDTTAGQLWLLVVACVLIGSGALLRHYSDVDVPDRFTLRTTTDDAAGVGR